VDTLDVINGGRNRMVSKIV